MKKQEQQRVAQWRADAPACCKACDHYLPMMWNMRHKECDYFGDCTRVKGDRCGAWAPRGERQLQWDKLLGRGA